MNKKKKNKLQKHNYAIVQSKEVKKKKRIQINSIHVAINTMLTSKIISIKNKFLSFTI